MNRLLCHLRRAALLSASSGPGDAQLLDAFLSQHDEAAFEALVRRHGPMVHSVCRRVVGNIHDADDAFQATFIVLVRKAASLRKRHLLAGWLYGVAFRTALKARAMSHKRRAKEKQAAQQPLSNTAADTDAANDANDGWPPGCWRSGAQCPTQATQRDGRRATIATVQLNGPARALLERASR
ncbi:MAG TPA: sigma-70 family RNA polymerase sigma factor [Gemmataceae bacterium]|nr:sigma-70 family RNA polymerase sigma factor [Gemmataceae bacterium]